MTVGDINSGLGQIHHCWHYTFIPFSIHWCAVWTLACQEDRIFPTEKKQLSKRNKLKKNKCCCMESWKANLSFQLWLQNKVLWGSRLSRRTVLKIFAEDKAAAVFDSEYSLMVVKILSVPIIFMKMFYVLAKIWVGMTSALKVCIKMGYLTPKGCLIISTTNSSKV